MVRHIAVKESEVVQSDVQRGQMTIVGFETSIGCRDRRIGEL